MRIPYVYLKAEYKALLLSFFKTRFTHIVKSKIRTEDCYSNNWRFKDATVFFVQYGVTHTTQSFGALSCRNHNLLELSKFLNLLLQNLYYHMIPKSMHDFSLSFIRYKSRDEHVVSTTFRQILLQ
jgi:hypothetical protein